MDTNIEKRAFPLPYPESPCAAEWLAANAPKPIPVQTAQAGAQ